MGDPQTLDARKHAARVLALQRRLACDPGLGERLAEHVLADCPAEPAAIVAGVWPLPGEIDIRPLLIGLAARGNPLALPVTPRKGLPLVFRRWAPGEPLEAGRFGTMHPTGPEIDPDIILIPMLAFDRQGRRLGYGGGFYDRTLAQRPGARRLGVAFADLEIHEVPAGPDDMRLPRIATERGIIHCENEGY